MLIWIVSESLGTEARKVTHIFAREPGPSSSEFFLPPQLGWCGQSCHVPPKQESAWDRDQGFCKWGLRGHIMCKPGGRDWRRVRAGDDSEILMLKDITL